MMEVVLAPVTLTLILGALVLGSILLQSKYRKTELLRTTASSQGDENNIQETILSKAPGPVGLPIIGNLHQLFKHRENPSEGFTIMARKFGDVFCLKLGSFPCLVVSNFEGIKEVLINKGNSFDMRPDFPRWKVYFDGNRQKSLAFCDWSGMQRTRRNLARSYLLFRQNSQNFNVLSDTIASEMVTFMKAIEPKVDETFKLKNLASYCAMNIFTKYLCSTVFNYTDPEFQHCVSVFDEIFEDINNGHITDFFPFLMSFFSEYKSKLQKHCKDIRYFILNAIIKERAENAKHGRINDLVDVLLCNSKDKNSETCLDWETILFELEDILGGSAAISNTVIRGLYFVAAHQRVMKLIQNELDETLNPDVAPSINHRPHLKYLEATVLEVLRHTSSIIVPHVAREDTSVAGFFVRKGTTVLLNNYNLNTSPNFWEKAEEFRPERFLVDGHIKKPSYFIPFSTGKRACIGSKLVMNITIVTMANILKKYNISIPNIHEITISKGRIALQGDGYDFCLSRRA